MPEGVDTPPEDTLRCPDCGEVPDEWEEGGLSGGVYCGNCQYTPRRSRRKEIEEVLGS